MKVEHITESVANAIEKQIYKEWKHEGVLLGMSSIHVNFEVDDKEYVLVVHEIEEGKDFSSYSGECK